MPSWRSPGRIRVWTNVPNSSSLSHTSVMRSTPSPNEATWKRIPAGASRSQPTSSRSASYWPGVMPSHFCMMTVAMVIPPGGDGGGGVAVKTELQRQRVAEHAGARQAAGERADEVEGVDVDALAALALAEGPAGRAVQDELERLPVDGGPFGDDVGDQPAVVVGGELHRPAGRAADVDAVAPGVAGEPHVEEVFERLPADRRAEREWHESHRRRRAPPAPDRPRAYLLELAGDLGVGQISAPAALQ